MNNTITILTVLTVQFHTNSPICALGVESSFWELSDQGIEDPNLDISKIVMMIDHDTIHHNGKEYEIESISWNGRRKDGSLNMRIYAKHLFSRLVSNCNVSF